MNDFWKILGIEPTNDRRAIRFAYSEQSRKYHPEEEPEAFRQLHEAYRAALAYAAENAAWTEAPVPSGGFRTVVRSRENSDAAHSQTPEPVLNKERQPPHGSAPPPGQSENPTNLSAEAPESTPPPPAPA